MLFRMLVCVFLILSSIHVLGKCENSRFLRNPNSFERFTACVTGILKKYYSDSNTLTYINRNSDDEDLLKAIHSLTEVSLMSRQFDTKSFLPNEGYLINIERTSDFTESFQRLTMDTTWNPYARFLIIVKLLQAEDLKQIFDTLLKLHVINVVVMNGTDESHLFTYNPFDNFACGRYYNNIIGYGPCSKATNNFYPYKLVNGLNNCTITATVPDRPPFTIHPPTNENNSRIPIGVEQYLFDLISEAEGFNVEYDYNFGNESIYPTVNSDMKSTGPLKKLQNNETDVIFGSAVLVSVRAEAFTYLHGHLDYTDEVRIVVPKASYVPRWRYIYLEFSLVVWCLLLLVFGIYTSLIIILLRAEDKAKIALKLFDIILAHGWNIRCRLQIKCIFIIWVWFGNLINNFYLSSLVSLNSHPVKEYQVSNIDDIIEFQYRPCITSKQQIYIATEIEHYLQGNEYCDDPIGNVNVVANSKDMYTFAQKLVLIYHMGMYVDDNYDGFKIHIFDDTFVNLILPIYFYKGFPITDKMRWTAIRLKENGLADKRFSCFFYSQMLKMNRIWTKYRIKYYLPWPIYLIGCFLSTITFVLERMSKYKIS